jgi:DNA-binding beta-propeller fold protein YncE
MRAILAGVAALALALLAGRAAADAPEFTPTGQFITPAATPGATFQPLNPHLAGDPSYTAGQAAAVALSPDGRTLLILTSGYNLVYAPSGDLIPAESNEYVFVYDVSGPAPVQRQAIPVKNTFLGLAWAPSGGRFYVSGGVDDVVYEYRKAAVGAGVSTGPRGSNYDLPRFEPGRTFKLGHAAGVGLAVKPSAGALAVSPDGTRLLVANFQNDSVSLIDLTTGAVREQDLRPGVIDPGPGPRAAAFRGR